MFTPLCRENDERVCGLVEVCGLVGNAVQNRDTELAISGLIFGELLHYPQCLTSLRLRCLCFSIHV